MDDDTKAALAKQGMRAAELVEPGKIGEKVKDSVADAAGNAALRGLAAIGRLTGKDRSPPRARAAAAVDLNRALDAFDADDAADFEQRVRKAAALKAQEEDESRKMDLDVLRRSFPDASRELALLIFNCADLLEDLSTDAEGQPPSDAELVRKEKLLERVAELLAPRSGEALLSFVHHVVRLSQRYRRR
ncbi:MAG: hypothetical protein JRI23_24745 [Deltaproteobacteria bacterium]|jgi:hypothetical protein|nr:hypothetical protein [Deltaproteobacteria bacterium]MBW2535212.1 hypothetical protein [Deltaproteobacteria bacterium]